jgi:hypothetical protein
MLGLLPQTYATTTFNPVANPYNPLAGLLSLLGGGINLPGFGSTSGGSS